MLEPTLPSLYAHSSLLLPRQINAVVYLDRCKKTVHQMHLRVLLSIVT